MDARLLKRLKRGEQAAWAEVRAMFHRTMVLSALRVLKNMADAEEAASYAWMQAWRHRHDLREAKHMKTWLVRVSLNAALTKYRDTRQERTRRVEWDSAGVWALAGASEDPLARRECLRLLRRLPPSLSIPCALRYLEEWTIDDIADKLGLSVGAVKSRIHRGMLALKALAEQENEP